MTTRTELPASSESVAKESDPLAAARKPELDTVAEVKKRKEFPRIWVIPQANPNNAGVRSLRSETVAKDTGPKALLQTWIIEPAEPAKPKRVEDVEKLG